MPAETQASKGPRGPSRGVPVTGSETPKQFPLVVDLVRAYEGILLGLVVIVLAATLAGGTYGVYDFAAVLVIPAVLMLVFMRQGARPRRLFAVRAFGALLGWALIWIVFIPLFLIFSYAVIPGSESFLVYVALAILDGIILGLTIAGLDRIGRFLRRRTAAAE